jgi:hypothetical protein
MSEKGGASANERRTPASKSLSNLRPWKPGQSGNPNGRPKIEARVRRYARRYDRRMCKVLAQIAEDPKVAPSERRRAAMDLIACGSGRPALVQELTGRDGQPVGPLVSLSFQSGHGGGLSPSEAYHLMCQGTLEADPKHPAFERGTTIEARPEPAAASESSGDHA